MQIFIIFSIPAGQNGSPPKFLILAILSINLDLQSWNIQMQKLHFSIGGCEIRSNSYSSP